MEKDKYYLVKGNILCRCIEAKATQHKVVALNSNNPFWVTNYNIISPSYLLSIKEEIVSLLSKNELCLTPFQIRKFTGKYIIPTSIFISIIKSEEKDSFNQKISSLTEKLQLEEIELEEIKKETNPLFDINDFFQRLEEYKINLSLDEKDKIVSKIDIKNNIDKNNIDKNNELYKRIEDDFTYLKKAPYSSPNDKIKLAKELGIFNFA